MGTRYDYIGGENLIIMFSNSAILNPERTVIEGVFSTLDLLPTIATLIGGEVPTDRVMDGVNRLDEFLGFSGPGDFLKVSSRFR